ncbi:MAG: sodium:calcium antiporter [Candidatus Dormibacteria bacterium]
MDVLFFAGGLLLIISASELFTNAVEWAGFRLGLSTGATGSLLAAMGTSLPETVVPVVALLSGEPSAPQVATGAVLGAAFLLLTLGAGFTGLAVMARRRRTTIDLEPAQVRRDLGVFLGGFSAVLVAILLPLWARIALGVLLLLTYALYVRSTLRGGSPAEDMPEPLHLVRWRPGRPHSAAIAAQLVAAIGALVIGSDLFVHALNDLSTSLHANPLTLALIIVPIATELPETLNSVLWIRSGDDALAFGNVAGSAAFQACILGFIGVTFTPWRPDGTGILSGLLTLATAAGLLLLLRQGRARGAALALAALPWVAYVVVVVLAGNRLA